MTNPQNHARSISASIRHMNINNRPFTSRLEGVDFPRINATQMSGSKIRRYHNRLRDIVDYNIRRTVRYEMSS